MRKKLFTLLLAIVASAGTLFASDTQVDGIWYDFDDANLTASVTYRGNSSNEYGGEYEGNLIIPDKVIFNGKTYSVTKVGSFACWPYSNLTSVVLPNTLTEIESYAFGGSSELASINIPDGITSIGTYAFYGCTSLISIDIPNSVTSIGSQAFYGITNINYLGDVIPSSYDFGYWGAQCMNAYRDGDLFYSNQNKRELLACLSSAQGEIAIPNVVNKIGKYCFFNCTKITTIIIPESVVSIGASAFENCKQLTSIVIPNKVSSIEDGTFSSCENMLSVVIGSSVKSIGGNAFSKCYSMQSVYMLPNDCPTISYSSLLFNTSARIYVPFGCIQKYLSNSIFESKFKDNIEHMPVLSNMNISSTSNLISFVATYTILVSVGIEGGEQQAGNVLEYIGLEPDSEYKDVPVVLTANTGETETVNVSFTTTALELTTKPSKPVSSTTAILLAETNMSDAEVSCGFEYKRNDAPADMDGTKVFCPVASGQMAGRLKGLKDDVYYKYRAFYQSAAGNMYYGDWQYIFTGDVAVEFDPILYTYGATIVKENEATISGYALAGSEDFTEQGFEYWAETRANGGTNAPRRMPAALDEHFFVQASGISLRVTLNNLDAGTVYKYRVYGKVGDQYYYGSEQTFTTQGTYTPPTYTITFANWDGSELQSSQVEEGTLPEYTGATPERPEDEQYTYSFNGWTPTIVIASADATYTATYTATPKSQGIDNVQRDDVQCTKVLRDGQIVILRGEKVYSITGQEVR